MKKITNLLNKPLINNMSWLFVLNIFNSLVPYLILPYVTRQFGAELYGKYSFAITVIGYFSVLIEFGFDLTGARQLAHSETKMRHSIIFSRIFICRMILLVISIVGLFIGILTVGKIGDCYLELLLLVPVLISNALSCSWFFHGLQKVRIVSIASIVLRFIYAIAVLMFVQSADDFRVFIGIYSITALLTSVIPFIIAITKFEIRIRYVKICEIIETYKQAMFIFFSNVSIKLASTVGVMIVGLLYSFTSVGYYSLMEKIATLITMTYLPIGQALYPEVSKRMSQSFLVGCNFVKRVARIVIPFYLALCVIIAIFSETVIEIAFGVEYLEGKTLLMVMLLIPPLSVISNLLGTQILLAHGNNKEYWTSFAIGSLVGMCFYILLVYLFQSIGVVLANVTWEMITIGMMLFYVKRINRREISVINE